MVDHSSLAFGAVLLPLLVALPIYFLARIPKIGNNLAKALCVMASYATFALVLGLTYVVTETGPVAASFFDLALPVGAFALSVHVDALALIPALFFALLAAVAITYSVKYLGPENRHRYAPPTFNRAYPFMLFFLGSLLGGCFSGNLLAFLVFWEMTSICAYVLVGFWHADPASRAASFKTFIMTHIGTFCLVVGAVLIYPAVGTWEIHRWSEALLGHPVVPLAALLFFVGILPKAVQFPLHTWFPDATVTATPIVVYVHGGFLMGLYLLVRFFGQIFAPLVAAAGGVPLQLSLLFGNINLWSLVISVIGGVTLIVAALFGLVETDSKRVAAYCDVSALGGTVMTLGFVTHLGLAAGLLGMIYHVLFSALIFLAVGGAIFRVGETSMNGLGGLSNSMPITAALGSLGALSVAGFPFLGYFTAVWLGIHASLELNAPLFAILLLVGSVLKTAAILRLFHATFFGSAPEYQREVTESPALMLFPMAILSACLLGFGVYPQLLLNSLVLPAIGQLHPWAGSEVSLVLDDILTGSGFWNPMWATVAFLSCVGVLAAGVYFASKRSAASIERSFIKKEEALKPFLCGEDTTVLESVRATHFYHTLTTALKIDQVCAALDVDRLYDRVSRAFFGSCEKLLRLDIEQRYLAAVVSFVAGAVVLVLVAILAV